MSKNAKMHPGDLELRIDLDKLSLSPVREDAPFFFIRFRDNRGWHSEFVHLSNALSYLKNHGVSEHGAWVNFFEEEIRRIHAHYREVRLISKLLQIARAKHPT